MPLSPAFANTAVFLFPCSSVDFLWHLNLALTLACRLSETAELQAPRWLLQYLRTTLWSTGEHLVRFQCHLCLPYTLLFLTYTFIINAT